LNPKILDRSAGHWKDATSPRQATKKQQAFIKLVSQELLSFKMFPSRAICISKVSLKLGTTF
jgi:hypothetical protein